MKTVKCPYNPVHIMPQNSLLNHLSRCTATNKHQFTKCKYNPVHVILKIAIDDHYKICKDRTFDFDSDEDWDQIADFSKKNNNQSYYDSCVQYCEQRKANNNNNKKKFVEKKELCSESQEDQQQVKSFESYTQKSSEFNSSFSEVSIKTVSSSISKLSIQQNSTNQPELPVYDFQQSSLEIQKQEKKENKKKKQKKSGDSQLQVYD